MSNNPNRSSDYRKVTLERTVQARAAHKFGEALIWLNTSACLDSDDDRINPLSEVNTAYFQLVYDIARECETIVLRSGHVTTTHGVLLNYGQEAIEALRSRLTDASPEGAHALVFVLNAHFEDLFEQLGRFFDKSAPYVLNNTEQARLMRDTVRAVQTLIGGVNDLTIDQSALFGERAVLLYNCATSPDYLIFKFPFAFLTEWDRALFFVDGARSLLTDMRSHTGFVPAAHEAALTQIDLLLQEADRLIKAQSKDVKRLYPRLSNLTLGLSAR